MIWQRTLHELWLACNYRRWRRYRRALQEPGRVQDRYLAQLLSRNADTAFGKTHHFDKLASVHAFQQNVPIRDYDELVPWMDRIRQGEKSVLTHDAVQRLIPSSGSTTASKLIPWTASLQREFNQAIAPWLVDLYATWPAAKSGPAYWSISPAIPEQRRADSAIPIGFDSDSSYLGGWHRKLVEPLLAVPSEIRHAEEIETFRYLTALCLLRTRELRLVSVWHPSFFTLLLDAAAQWWDRLCCDIADGTCRPPTAASNAFMPRGRRDLARANELARIGAHQWSKVWPLLTLISCWTAAYASHAAQELSRQLPHIHVQGKGLLATEAFVTLPMGQQWPLAIRSHFFEFLDEDGQIHLAQNLQQDGVYEVVVTTGGGLYRYRLGDLVRVEGFVGRTPSLIFLGRADCVSDRVGEKLNESAVAKVLREILHPLPNVRFAMLAPDVPTDASPRYVLYLETAKKPPNELAVRLEEGLVRNIHYRHAVELGQLQRAAIRLVGHGAAKAYAHRMASRGMSLGDIKPLAMSTLDDWDSWLPAGTAPGGGRSETRRHGRTVANHCKSHL